ncbi:hypothetical protein VPH35_029635 [Triticum aestivum]
MARGDHQDDDDDFMDAPQQNRATGQAKDGEEKKKRHCNRASHERLTILNDGFTDEQKGAAGEMGMQALMDVRRKNLVNPVCNWLGEIDDPASREFVIPGRGRLPLDEDSVFCTLGVPCGEIKVPYDVNNKIKEGLFPRLFLGVSTMPNMTVLATSLEGMTTHGEAKLKDVKKMNWCKFIADFLHDAFSNKMYQKGCHLHLMLMYVDALDFTRIGGPPPAHKFDVSAWTNAAIKVVLA